MRRLEAKDLKEMNLVKHYRIIRQWAAKNNNLTSADIAVSYTHLRAHET